MKQKQFLTRRKHRRRRQRAKLKVKLYEKGKLKHADLTRLAKKLLARKRRQAVLASQ